MGWWVISTSPIAFFQLALRERFRREAGGNKAALLSALLNWLYSFKNAVQYPDHLSLQYLWNNLFRITSLVSKILSRSATAENSNKLRSEPWDDRCSLDSSAMLSRKLRHSDDHRCPFVWSRQLLFLDRLCGGLGTSVRLDRVARAQVARTPLCCSCMQINCTQHDNKTSWCYRMENWRCYQKKSVNFFC